MHIELTIEDQVVKRFYLPDEYLQDIPTLTEEQNFNARQKIIAMHVEQLKQEFAHLFASYVIEIWLVFESRMNRQREEKSPENRASGYLCK